MELRDVDHILVHLFDVVRQETLVDWHYQTSNYQEIGAWAALNLFVRPEDTLLAESEQVVTDDEE